MRVVGWALVAVAGFLATAALVYAASSGEEAGSVLLLLAAGLAIMIGGYLLTLPSAETPVAGSHAGSGGHTAREPVVETLYLPAASIWPFWVGLGGVVLANGVPLGLWGLIPGAIVTTAGLLGFARQSRHRE